LAPHAIFWGKRKKTAKLAVLTERDLRLMALLYDTNFLSASHLTLLGWGRDSDAASKRLRRLHDSGYIDKFRGPAPTGSSEWNYRLTSRGWQALIHHRIAREEVSYEPVELQSLSYAEHDLQLNALILNIALLATGLTHTPLLDRLPFHWQGPRTGRIDRQSSVQPTKIASAAKLPPETQQHSEESRPGYLEPDATLTGAVGDDHFAVLIEYDRTSKAHKQIDRLRRYDNWFLNGWRHTHFASHSLPPTVIFITSEPGPLVVLW
jgi:hypothetical protein